MANQEHQVKGLEAHLRVIQSHTAGAEVAVLRLEAMIGSRLIVLGMTHTVSYFLYEMLLLFYTLIKTLHPRSFFGTAETYVGFFKSLPKSSLQRMVFLSKWLIGFHISFRLLGNIWHVDKRFEIFLKVTFQQNSIHL